MDRLQRLPMPKLRMPRQWPAAVVAVLSAVVALAASLNLATATIGAARTSVPRCTAAGLGVIQNLSASNAVSVTVSNLPSGCGGATIQVTVDNGSTSSSGSATVPSGGGSITVSLASAVAVAVDEETDVVLTGP
jgi:hypothetical protein